MGEYRMIARRLVEITAWEAGGEHGVAVGLVKRGLAVESGMPFVFTGPNAEVAARRVALEMEAYFHRSGDEVGMRKERASASEKTTN
jgi:hypothetical protein